MQDSPGVGTYNLENEVDWKYNIQKGYTIPTYHQPGVSIETEYGPCPWDYCDKGDSFVKYISLEKSERPDYEKFSKKIPGVGAYQIQGDLVKENSFERLKILII